MKKLVEFLLENIQCSILVNESTFTGADWLKRHHTYAQDVIDRLVNGETIRLGAKGDGGEYAATPEEIRELKKLKPDYTNDTQSAFDKIFNGKLKWTKIFKGDFSGRSASGREKVNKGNEFEKEFYANYQEKYEDDIRKIIPYDDLIKIDMVGGLNNRRPLQINNKYILLSPCIPGKYDIGEIVSDITLETDKGEVYLSLKYGNKVTFCNEGIKKVFDKEFFKGNSNQEADMLCDLFGLDPKKIKQVFDNYVNDGVKRRSEKEVVDITNKLSRDKKFMDLLKSVIGYGFILVHQHENGQIHYYDLRTRRDMIKFIGKITKAEIRYPVDGRAKRVDIIVETNHLDLDFAIRSKDGGILPSHMMADYKIKEP